MLDGEYYVIGFVLNIFAILFDLCTFILSITIFICIIYELYSARIKRQERIILILSANIYICICLFGASQFLFGISSLLGDLYGIRLNFSWCIFNGFFMYVVQSGLYYGFATQGFFRLYRIVYSRFRWLRFYWLYILATPIETLLAAVFLSPLLFWNDVVYLPNENYCYVLFTNIRGILWAIFNLCLIPFNSLFFIYFRIIIYIRRHSNNQSLAMRNKQRQDLLVIQRIFLTCGLLMILQIPTTVLILLAFINGVEHPLTYRITIFLYSTSIMMLSIALIFGTTQLKALMLKLFRRNRVTPVRSNMTGSNPARVIAVIGPCRL